MDQQKTGRFIAACRKEKNLTQVQVGDALGVTDRAVSKWERGLSLPDASIMQDLCGLLDITINELFTGERLEHMDDYNKKAEENLLEMKRREEEKNRQMFQARNAIGLMSIGVILSTSIVMFKQGWIENWRHIGGRELIEHPEFLVPLGIGLAGVLYAGQVERKAGYYKCEHCGYTYVCTPEEFIRSMHFGSTRYMKCPECGKKSWIKKVLVKDD